ncbi:ADP-ribose-binding protein [Acidianus brierleyi]|uniref:ADP-ribose-binding protein n=1 Tax=Acidianus brierleyi TaxID=41673 RepID=A0A2U9IH12_9CREN|nr:ADP-ribose-binding protein [Acidianus brierleyi]
MKLSIRKCDITQIEADAIVNAANSYLEHGGGVAWAIVKKGGYIIQEESREYVRKNGPIPTGEVAVTSAGNLRAKYVIHAVGPRYGVEGDDKLESAIRKSLDKAKELGVKRIAFPAISTGIYGYPYERCAEIMAKVILEKNPEMEIIICLYSDDAFEVFKGVFSKYFLF